jgi:aminoglycoside phosphotransferase (APT) family kinase protein
MSETRNAAPLDPKAIKASLARMKLLAPGQEPRMAPLAGGVSSDIWRIDLGGRRLCLKRALPRLKTAQLWEAPVARNRFEWDWYKVVASFCPEAVPPLVAQDAAAGLFVMEYLEPAEFPLWKNQLRLGQADVATARAVGARLALIHARTADDAALAEHFRTDESFYAIRLEPYLVATARAHPELKRPLETLVAVTAGTRRALVHGDVSPKNILVGSQGPIFLDAECAWYGDPAFDIAFCLNHLLLKCLWVAEAADAFLRCFDDLAESYFAGVDWEEATALEARVARLLPGLFLARVDGKSPVEYVTAEADKDRVRRVAAHLLTDPATRLEVIRQAWRREISA